MSGDPVVVRANNPVDELHHETNAVRIGHDPFELLHGFRALGSLVLGCSYQPALHESDGRVCKIIGVHTPSVANHAKNVLYDADHNDERIHQFSL